MNTNYEQYEYSADKVKAAQNRFFDSIGYATPDLSGIPVEDGFCQDTYERHMALQVDLDLAQVTWPVERRSRPMLVSLIAALVGMLR